MRFGWRAISGPALTAATLLLAMLFDRFVPTPSPAPLFICIVALAGALAGLASAMTTAVLAVIDIMERENLVENAFRIGRRPSGPEDR